MFSSDQRLTVYTCPHIWKMCLLKALCKMEHLLLSSNCSILHNVFKTFTYDEDILRLSLPHCIDLQQFVTARWKHYVIYGAFALALFNIMLNLTLSPPNKLLSAKLLVCFNIQGASMSLNQRWWKCPSVKQLGSGWDGELLAVSFGFKLFASLGEQNISLIQGVQ